jgi:tRNA-binding protein
VPETPLTAPGPDRPHDRERIEAVSPKHATAGRSAGRGEDLSAAPARARVGPDAFAALDLRVAWVVEVLPFPEARRPAWRMVLDGGPALGRLQTSAQLTRYSAEELLGRLVVVAVNLGPRRIAGWRSDVLVLAAVPGDGPRLLGVDGDVAPGTPVS